MTAKAGTAGGTQRAPAAAWLFDLDMLGECLATEETRCPRLSEAEIARAAEMRDGVRRMRWVMSRTCLRLALEAWMGTSLQRRTFEVAHGGRPFLPASAPSFNLSHEGRYALIAIADKGPVGADIEAIAVRKISPGRCAQMEAFAIALADGAPLPGDALAAGEGAARFVQAWCRIEACAKADGRGVARILSEAGILGRGSMAARAAGAALARPAEPCAFRAFDLQLGALAPGFAAAVAGPAGAPLAQLAVRDGAALLHAAS